MFVDGVRLDEPLADQVNWDLVPADVIERIELIPGSNPVYGRNTLGGALVMQTKRGQTNPGTTAATRSIASTHRSARRIRCHTASVSTPTTARVTVCQRRSS